MREFEHEKLFNFVLTCFHNVRFLEKNTAFTALVQSECVIDFVGLNPGQWPFLKVCSLAECNVRLLLVYDCVSHGLTADRIWTLCS